jgi:hypothetical protein
MAWPEDYNDHQDDFLNSMRQAASGTDRSPVAGTHAGHHNRLAAAVNVIEQTLGLDPAGSYATVAERLDAVIAPTMDTITAPTRAVAWGVGDNSHFYTSVLARTLDLRDGSAAAPSAAVQPMAKFQRYQNVARSAVTGDGAEQLAAVIGMAVAGVASEVQAVGGGFFAKTLSTVAGPGNDACGLYFGGRAMTGATGAGIGGFGVGRRDDDAGRATALELHVYNGGTTDGRYEPAGASDVKGQWMTAGGAADSAVAYQIGNTQGRQFLYGFAANAQVAGDKTGGIKLAFMRDDSHAEVSYDIRGVHSVAAIRIADASGPLIVGGTALVNAGARFEVQAAAGTYDPLVGFHVPGSTSSHTIRQSNGVGSQKLFVAGGNGAFLRDVVAGDVGVQIGTAGKIWHCGVAGGRAMLRVGTNIGIGTAAGDSVGGGVGVVFLANAGTIPSSNPASGGIFYIDPADGAFKFRGSRGTTTILAPA